MGIIPRGRLTCEVDPAVVAAVVETFTVTVAAVPWATLTEAGTEQTGAGVTAGMIAQLRLTVPINDPEGVTARLKDAVCPAEIVAEFEDPEAGPVEKPGAAVAMPDKPTLCGLPTALSVTARLAAAFPAAVGEKTTLMVQLAPG
jgi:hypothetical protein